MKNALIASLVAVAWLTALPASAGQGENKTPGGVAQAPDSNGSGQQKSGDADTASAPGSKAKTTPATDDGAEDIAENDAASPELQDKGEVDATVTGTDPKGD